MMAEKMVKKVPMEIWSRVVGYLRPVQNYNNGMKQMFYDRKMFSWGKAVEHAKR